MDLKTAKLVVFALCMELYEGVTAKSPTSVQNTWDSIQEETTFQGLTTDIEPGLLAKFLNYCRLWGKVEDGLTEELPAPGISEAEKGGKGAAEQSESAIKEVQP